MVSDPHDPKCRWPQGPPCRKFSTDGTLLGAEIAHTMGTTDEKVISQLPIGEPFASDVGEEQADWEADEQCGAVKEEGFTRAGVCKLRPGHYPRWHEDGGLSWEHEPGPHPHHDEPMHRYPANRLDWN